MSSEARIREEAGGKSVTFNVKAVPGARRDEIAGWLGDRLKVRVSQPPEGGRANAAICELLAEALGIPARNVEIIRGHTNPEKTVRVSGVSTSQVQSALNA